ncbi:MAG TPA: MFS transporter [Ktedonobacteraceae bacterium]|nr:MFS transporter [Ktedonobacteraceae bacterium]
MKRAVSVSLDGRVTGIWSKIITSALIVLVGFNLRTIILAVPPILPLIQHDLALSYSEVGLLTAIPVLMIGITAWPAGLLAERIGGRACVAIGLTLLGVGALLRALSPTVIPLYLCTVVLSLGIAIAQTSIPILTRRWFPAQIGMVSALFSDGLIVGEAIAAGITVPIMLQFLGSDAWRGTFIVWGVPVVVLLALWLLFAPPVHEATPASSPVAQSGESRAEAAVRGDAPAARRGHVNALHLGILVGMGSLIYYGMNAWVASYNQAMLRTAMTPLALAVLNASQLPVSLGITFFAQRIAGRRWPFIVVGVITIASVAGWIFAPAPFEPLWTALLGGSSSMVFTLGIALPPLLAQPDEVARLTGITFSLTYAVAFVGPFVGGGLWDLSHLPPLAFLPIGLAGLLLIILGALLPRRMAFDPAVADRVVSAVNRAE